MAEEVGEVGQRHGLELGVAVGKDPVDLKAIFILNRNVLYELTKIFTIVRQFRLAEIG